MIVSDKLMRALAVSYLSCNTWPGKSANCRTSERSNLTLTPADSSCDPSNITDCEFNFPFESQQICPMTDTSS